MQKRIEAQMAITALYVISCESVRLTRRKYVREDKVERGLLKHMEPFSERLDAARQVPKEFQLIDATELEISSTEDMHAISPRLGELVVRRTTVKVRDALKPVAV